MTRRRQAVAAVAAAALGAGTAVGVVAADGGEEPVAPPPAATALDTTASEPTVGTAEAPAPARRGPTTAQARDGRWSARLMRPALLRERPGSRRIARVGRRTGYGAKRVFAVGAFKPGWVGVRALQRPNGQLAWLPEDAVRLQRIRTTLVADLSDREITLRRDGKVRRRAPIGIGRPGSTTPIGRYGVTDRLKSATDNATYGCCVLPLTGHQPNLPPGWQGGTRLALHGTPKPGSVGREVSAGCLRMRNKDIRRLMASVPLGTTLTVRR